MVLPRLVEKNHFVVGEDFFLIFSPERIDPGRKDWTTKNTPKIIGGMTDRALKLPRYGTKRRWIRSFRFLHRKWLKWQNCWKIRFE